LDSDKTNHLLDIKFIIDKYPGDTEAVLILGENKQAIKLPQKIDPGPEIIDEINAILGENNAKLN